MIQIGQTQLVLCVNHTTRFPIFLPAKPIEQFPVHLENSLRTILKQLDVSDDLIEQECLHHSAFMFSTTNNHSVIGSIIGLSRLAVEHFVSADPTDLINLSIRFAQKPSPALQYDYPDQAAKHLFVS